MQLHRFSLASLLAVPLYILLPQSVVAQATPPAAGNIAPFAGDYQYRGPAGSVPDTGVQARSVSLATPDGLALDATNGDLYIADKNDNVVRKVNLASGIVTTVAGTGTAGYTGDNGLAINATLFHPISVAVDATGDNLYIADYDNHVVRHVFLTGASAGNIETVAGNGTMPSMTGTSSDPIGDGGPATSASIDPQSVAVDFSGDVYIADSTHKLVRKVDHNNPYTISTFAGTLYSTSGYNSLAEGQAPTNAYFVNPKAIAFDSARTTLYIADQYGHRVYKVSGGVINTFAGNGSGGSGAFSGDGGPATSAQLNAPAGLAVDSTGNVFLTDQDNHRIRKVDTTGAISTVAGNGTASPTLPGDGTPAPGDGGLAINAEISSLAAGLAIKQTGPSDPGFLYIADYSNSVVRFVNLTAAATAATTLTTNAPGAAATFTVTGNGCEAGSNLADGVVRTWTAGAICTVTVNVPSGYTYAGWSDSAGAPNPRVFTASGSPATYTAQLTVVPPACTYSLSTTTASVAASANDGTVSVTSASGCAWMATSNDSWLTITAGANSTANGMVTFHADANTATSIRTGTLTVAGTTFTVTQAAAAVTPPPTTTSGLRFVPVAPCRVADTRDPAGPFGAPYLSSQTTREFEVPKSKCGIPSDAQAYSMNFTVIPTKTLQYITVFPTGQTQPLASTLNSFDGRIKANAAIVPAGTNGSISVFSTDETQLIVDVNGYFVSATNTAGLAFYPMTPCRIVDTRPETKFASGAFGPPAFAANEERTIPVMTSSCQIPSAAKAYSLNYTVIPSKGKLNYLTTWPTGGDRPLVSTLNAPTGVITANAAIVPANGSGDISVYSTDDTHVLIDINGYFAPPATGGLAFYNLAPCRVFDTRQAAGAAPTVNTLGVTIGGTCNAPADAKSYVFNATVIPLESLQYLTLWPHGAAEQPTVSALNAPDARITSNMAIVPSTDGSINAFTPNSTHLILDIFGYFAP